MIYLSLFIIPPSEHRHLYRATLNYKLNYGIDNPDKQQNQSQNKNPADEFISS